MIKAILFDLDGTLLDTSEGIMDSVKYTIHELKLPKLSKNTILKFVGPPIQNSLMEYCGLSTEDAQKGANVFRDYYRTQALFKATPYPGILELLQLLKNKGVKIGVATYKREDYALEILSHFGISRFCDVIHGADNNNVLSKGDIVNMCINEIAVNKSEVILIGDTDHDANGAFACNVNFIGVSWGFGYTKGSKIDYPNIGIVHKPIEIVEYL